VEDDDGVIDCRVWVGVQAKVRLPLTEKLSKIGGFLHIPSLGYDSHVNSLRTSECDPVSKVTVTAACSQCLTSATGRCDLDFLHRFCDVGFKIHVVWHE
jgi:hypothetical protein